MALTDQDGKDFLVFSFKALIVIIAVQALLKILGSSISIPFIEPLIDMILNVLKSMSITVAS
jgi:hypothetical protein